MPEITKTVSTEGSGTVVALMGFTVLFSLVGHELSTSPSQKQGNAAASVGQTITKGGTIILGGVFATALLVLLTHAGNAGRQFAVGLAGVSLVASALVYGAPVWQAANGAFGSTPTVPTGTAANTTPTKGG